MCTINIYKRPVVSFESWNVILCHLLNIQKHTLPNVNANANPVTAEVHVLSRTIIPLKLVLFVIVYLWAIGIDDFTDLITLCLCSGESDGLWWADLGQWGGTESKRLQFSSAATPVTDRKLSQNMFLLLLLLFIYIKGLEVKIHTNIKSDKIFFYIF